jgi:hypothetical protein
MASRASGAESGAEQLDLFAEVEAAEEQPTSSKPRRRRAGVNVGATAFRESGARPRSDARLAPGRSDALLMLRAGGRR